MTDKEFAACAWTVSDVLHVRPAWTKERALKFLQDNEDAIIDAMVKYGFERIESLADQDE